MDNNYSSHGQTWNILLVDDDEDDYYITRSMLAEARGRKFNLRWAADYQQALKALQADRYHAVLMDYDLGPVTGIELIRDTVQSNYPAPIILLTGRGSYEVDLEAMQAGATLYLTKDEINPLLLERSIRYAVERKEAEEELRRARDELEARVNERTEELRHTNVELEQANEALEARVHERTQALLTVNEELETINLWLEQVNHELALANYRLETVLQTQPAAVWIADAGGKILMKNPMADQIWGGEAPLSDNGEEYHEYRGWWAETGDELTPEDWGLARALQTAQPCVGQVIDILRFDGSHATIINSAAPVYDEQGKVAGAVAVAQDITRQRQLEQAAQEAAANAERQADELLSALDELDTTAAALSRSQEQLQLAVWAAKGGVWDLELHLDNPRVPIKSYLSPELKALIGFADDEFPNDLELWRSRFHPEDRDKIDQVVADTLENKAQDYQIEYRIRHKDGNLCWMASQAYISRDDQGRPRRWTGIDWEIQERKAAELERERLLNQYKHQRRFLEDLVNHSPVGIAFLEGPEHRYVLANPTFMELARGKGPLVGRTVAEVWPEIADRILPLLDQVFNTGEPVTYHEQSLALQREHGLEEGYFTYSLTPMFGGDGQVRGISMISNETTTQVLARLEIEAERDRLQSLLDRLQNNEY